MQEILVYYQQVSPTTWVYLSSLLTLAIYFKFNRLWSLRNLDLLALIMLAPGLVLVRFGLKDAKPDIEMIGYIWLFSAGGFFLLRMLLDAVMVRRPLLEPNLTVGGMVFLGVSLLIFLMAKIVTENPETPLAVAPPKPSPAATATLDPAAPAIPPSPPSLSEQFPVTPLPSEKDQSPDAPSTPGSAADQAETSKSDVAKTEASKSESAKSKSASTETAKTDALTPADKLSNSAATAEISPGLLAANQTNPPTAKEPTEEDKLSQVGPGFWLFSWIPNIGNPIFGAPAVENVAGQEATANFAATRTLAILAHFMVVAGIVVIGYWHFGNINTGIAAALLYLLLPYTAFYIGHPKHFLPAALLTWAFVFYRRPLAAGLLIGLASGTVYYPIFLLPLWLSFYWQRGLWRFMGGFAAALLVLIAVTAWNVESMDDFSKHLRLMLGFIFPTNEPQGFWGLLDKNFRVYRITVLAAHLAICGSFAIWPAQKNLGTLLSCSAAVMLSTQFWAAFNGGTSMAWYLPLLLLTVFRPNLEDRVALSVLGSGNNWLRRRVTNGQVSQAA